MYEEWCHRLRFTQVSANNAADDDKDASNSFDEAPFFSYIRVCAHRAHVSAIRLSTATNTQARKNREIPFARKMLLRALVEIYGYVIRRKTLFSSERLNIRNLCYYF